MGAQMVKGCLETKSGWRRNYNRYHYVQVLYSTGLKHITAGANPMDIKRGIDKAVAKVVEDLKKRSQIVGDDNKKLNKWQQFQ